MGICPSNSWLPTIGTQQLYASHRGRVLDGQTNGSETRLASKQEYNFLYSTAASPGVRVRRGSDRTSNVLTGLEQSERSNERDCGAVLTVTHAVSYCHGQHRLQDCPYEYVHWAVMTQGPGSRSLAQDGHAPEARNVHTVWGRCWSREGATLKARSAPGTLWNVEISTGRQVNGHISASGRQVEASGPSGGSKFAAAKQRGGTAEQP